MKLASLTKEVKTFRFAFAFRYISILDKLYFRSVERCYFKIATRVEYSNLELHPSV